MLETEGGAKKNSWRRAQEKAWVGNLGDPGKGSPRAGEDALGRDAL
jgi:hypothetical protein